MVASLGTSEKLVVNHFVVQIVTQQRMRCGDIVSSYSIHAKKKKALKNMLTGTVTAHA